MFFLTNCYKLQSSPEYVETILRNQVKTFTETLVADFVQSFCAIARVLFLK